MSENERPLNELAEIVNESCHAPANPRRPRYYEGTRPDGMHHSSVYPKLFRARFKRVMSGRQYDVERIVGGYNDIDVRTSIVRGDPHGEIRGDIAVEHYMDLEPVYEGAITDVLR